MMALSHRTAVVVVDDDYDCDCGCYGCRGDSPRTGSSRHCSSCSRTHASTAKAVKKLAEDRANPPDLYLVCEGEEELPY